MKRFFYFLMALMIFTSCLKDEQIAEEETRPAKTDKRTGQEELVWFDSTGIFAVWPELPSNDTLKKEVVNLRHYDSINKKTWWLSPSISPFQVECWQYNLKFYRNGEVDREVTAFTKYKGIEHTQIIQPHEGWDSDVMYYTITRSNTWTLRWVEECLKFKPVYLYTKRILRTSGPPQITQEYIVTTSCTRHTLAYPLKFKK